MFSKRLPLRAIHQIYQLLEHALPEQQEHYLLDELDKMTDNMKPGTIEQCLAIMYPNKDLSSFSGIKKFVLFVQSLNDNLFFDYVSFVKSFNGESKRQSKS